MRGKRFVYCGLGVLGVLTGAVIGYGQQSGPRLAAQQVITHGVAAGDVNSLDPALSGTSQDKPITLAVMEGLVDYPPGEISTAFQPKLAERWEISDDGRAYTFYLRKGVVFHEQFGPFTAADVEFTLNRYRDSKESMWAADYSIITSVHVVDDSTVKVTLKAPDPFFLSRVAGDNVSGGVMMSKKAFEGRGKTAMRLHPIGTGPFRFVEYRTKDRIVLARNDSYWGGKPVLEQITFRYMPSASARELALVSGEIHGMRSAIDAKLLDRLKRRGMVVDASGPEMAWLLHLNMSRKPFDDVRVRRAVAHAIKGEDLVNFMGSDIAELLFAPIPPTYFGAARRDEMPAQARYDYDPPRAKALLAQAGLPNGFDVSMIISERSDYREMMTIIQQHLKRVGINLQLNLVDHTTYHAQGMKDVNPIFLIGDVSYPDAGIQLKRIYHSALIVGKPTGMRNYSHHDNKQVDACLEEAERTGDLGTRRQIYAHIQRRVMEDLPVVPTVSVKQPLARRPELDLGYKLKSSLCLEYRFNKDSRLLQP